MDDLPGFSFSHSGWPKVALIALVGAGIGILLLWVLGIFKGEK